MARLSTKRREAEASYGGDGFDSADITAIAGTGLVVYSDKDSLPTSGLTAGDQAYVDNTNRLYISNGSGWYNVALINLSPTMSLDPSGAITLSTEGAASTVTITASDSDNPNAILTYTVESDGNGIGNYTISQDSSVFTITPLSEDSAANPGTFTLTFKTTDNINTVSETKDFSLSFTNFIDSSSQTVLLLKAPNEELGTYANKEFTFKDSADTATDWTANVGDVHAFTFNPYQGPYSMKFDGTGDYISANLASHIGDGDFCIECWVFIDEDRSTASRGIFQISNTSGGLQANATTNLMVAYRNSTYSHNWVTYAAGSQNNSSTASVAGQWVHVALVRSGSSTKLYIDGTSIQTISDSTNYNATNRIAVGGYYSTSYLWDGYIKDLRVVKGSAVYTGDFTPPTSEVTAITGTETLLCQLPYLGDVAGNVTTLKSNGNTAIVPYSPYNKEPYNGSQHGMNLQFNGTNQRIQYDTTTVNPGTSDCTWEGWLYPYTEAGTGLIFDTENRSTAGLRFYYDNNVWTVNGSDSLSISGSRWPGTTARQWTHFAITKSGSTYELYLDGVSMGTSSGASDVTGDGIALGCSYGTNTLDLKGAIADFHITKEQKYTTDFTPPTRAVAHSAGKTLLRFGNDVKMFDAAGTHEFHRVSSGGGPQLSTTTRKFTTSAAYQFTGNDILGIGSEHVTEQESGFRLDELPNGTEDFTIEMWFNCSAFSNYEFLYSQSYAVQVYLNSSGYIAFATNDTDNSTGYLTNVVDNVALSTDTWYHMAFVRNGSSHKLYIDGTEYLSATSSGSIVKSRAAGIGVFYYGSGSSNYWFNGYIQDVRVTKGLARYTAAFTPPTAEFDL